MGLDLSRDESAVAVSETIARYCASVSREADFRRRWRGLAELGFFAIPRDFENASNAAIAAGMEALGGHGFGGPLADTLAFAACAPADLVEPVIAGDVVVSLGRPPLMPNPEGATIHVTESGGQAALFEIRAAAPVGMLSGDPWARVEGNAGRKLGPFDAWQDRYDIAVSAWMVGAGLKLVEEAAAHAAQRVQFGRPIGDFQAISSPLARSALALDAAKLLTDAAAAGLDAGDGRIVTAARMSATRAAMQASITAHQTYGAFGVLKDGPVFPQSRVIRQLESQFPAPRPLDARSALGERSLGLVVQG